MYRILHEIEMMEEAGNELEDNKAKLTQYINECIILMAEGLTKHDAMFEVSCTYLFNEFEEETLHEYLDHFLRTNSAIH